MCILDMASKEEILHHSLNRQLFSWTSPSALHAQTGKSGVLAGRNCQPSVDPLDENKLFRGKGAAATL